MRVKSHIWVSGYVRRLDRHMVPCLIVRRGDADAGAIFIKVWQGDGAVQVLAPVPAYMLDGDPVEGVIVEDGRAWSPVFKSTVMDDEAERYLDRQKRQDDDAWVLEIESPEGKTYLGSEAMAFA
jgi:hypothetical protein